MSDRKTPENQSPCIKLCVMEPDSGFCMGCGRTRDEIASWISLSANERETVTGKLDQRLANLTRNKRRKGGRSNRLAKTG